MAVSLQTLDDLRDAFIDSGIGTSPLAAQQIQRANLPELSDSLRESLATQEGLREQSISNMRRQSIGSLQGLLRGMGSGGGRSSGKGADLPDAPSGVLKISRKTNISSGRVRAFNLRTADNAMRGRTFSTLSELATFLRANPSLASGLMVQGFDPNKSVSDHELKQLATLGFDLPRIDTATGKKLISGGRDFFSGFNKVTSFMSQRTPTAVQDHLKKPENIKDLIQATFGNSRSSNFINNITASAANPKTAPLVGAAISNYQRQVGRR